MAFELIPGPLLGRLEGVGSNSTLIFNGRCANQFSIGKTTASPWITASPCSFVTTVLSVTDIFIFPNGDHFRRWLLSAHRCELVLGI